MKQTFRADALTPILDKYYYRFVGFTAIYGLCVLLLTNNWERLPEGLRQFIWDNLSAYINNLAVFALVFVLIGTAIVLSILRIFFEIIRNYVYPESYFKEITTVKVFKKEYSTTTSGDSNVEEHHFRLWLSHPISERIMKFSVDYSAYNFFEKGDAATVCYNAKSKYILYLVVKMPFDYQ